MRTAAATCELVRPAGIDDALRLIAEGARPFAGGTDLMVQLRDGAVPAGRFVDLSALADLRGIEDRPDVVDVGALCTYASLRAHPVVRRDLPSLARAAELTGAVAIQNRGTLGGNIANASPAADALPVLLAYDARLVLRSAQGSRTVPYSAFHTGYKTMDLRPGELVARIQVPRPSAGAFHFFHKVGTRRAQAIAKLNLALLAEVRDKTLAVVRVGVGAVAPVPLRATHVEDVLTGRRLDELPVAEARDALDADMAPIDDLRSTADYRATVARNLLGQALVSLAAHSQPDERKDPR